MERERDRERGSRDADRSYEDYGYDRSHRDSERVRSKDRDRDRERDWDERSTSSSTSSSRDRDRDRDKDRERRRDKESSRDRDKESSRDRDKESSRDRDKESSRDRDKESSRDRDKESSRDRDKESSRDRDKESSRDRDRDRDRDRERRRDKESSRDRDRDRDRDRHRDRDRRDRDRDYDGDRDRDYDRRDYSSSRYSSSSFSRPATYDPRLAQRTQQRNRGDEDDDRYEDAIRRKQLQDELGLSDEEELPPGNSNTESSRSSSSSGGDSARVKELQRDLKEARDAEQKAQDSLNKLQLLSKSQTAILKTSMSKKIQMKEALVEEMANVIKELERKLTEAGVAFETYNGPESSRVASGRLNVAGPASDNDAEAEINAMKTEMERLIEENSALKAAASKSPSTDSKPPEPSQENLANKAALESAEAEKRQLMRQLKEMQQQLATLKSAVPTSPPPAPPAPPVVESNSSSGAPTSEEMQSLKSKLSAAETSHQNAQKTIQRLEKELAAASASQAAATPAPVEQGPSKLEQELQSQIRETESRLTELQTQLEQQKQDSQAKQTTADERYAKLKSTAEGELNKIKEQAKKAILDLKRKLEVASKGQQRKQATISNLSTQLKAQKSDIVTLKSQVTAQQQMVPVLAKQLTEKILQRVQKQADAMAGVVDNYKREMKERKRLFNLVQELKGNIRVLCRVRPISKNEIAQGSKMICKFSPEEITLSGEKGKVKTWEFDHVFDMGSAQDQLFSEVKPLVTSILDGYSVCIFAYGQTGSGKTFTMSGPPENPGINTRSLQELFERKSDRMKEYQDEITVSIMEIYNEQIRDLLAQDAANTNLQVRQGPTGNFVPGLTVVPVQSLDEVFELIKRGNKNRSTHATDMNEHSSRSHSILSIQLKSLNIVTNVVASGKLFLVDLAGSERLSKTGAEGQRLKEAQNINKSLSALGDVIAARASKQKHVPYRNSSLTYLLQDALGGDSKTLMVACASPVDYNSEETFCTLNFAARTRSVEMGKATKNVAQAT